MLATKVAKRKVNSKPQLCGLFQLISRRTSGSSLYRIDLLTAMLCAVSKKLAFTKDRPGKGNLEVIVFEYEISALHQEM